MAKHKLFLTNTLTRSKELFTPQSEKNISMYVCGITPYDHAHIGHARVYVVFDTLFRLLRHVYGEDAVTYVRNFTDIDDKILARAQENGQDWQALAQSVIASFHADMHALNVLPPSAEPRVTTSIPAIVGLIEKLQKKGIAYTAPDGVYYDTSKVPSHTESRCWCGLPRPYSYGKLSGKDKNTLRVARVEEADGKRNPGDFALWKFAKTSEPASAQWKSPWGNGRPGWHIECSAMAAEHLGETIDLHGGGEDLQFPHHENEIAQSEGATGGEKPFVNYWLHNGFITVGGTKMSKSLGNFTTIKDALEKYSPEAVRLWLLQTHYRKPVDYSDTALQAAEKTITRLYGIWNSAFKKDPKPAITAWQGTCSRLSPFRRALLDDLNTAAALAEFHTAANFLAESIKNDDEGKIRYWRQRFGFMAHLLGLLQNPQAHLARTNAATSGASPEVEALLTARQKARTEKNWKESDRLRDELKALGIVVEDKPDGTTTWRRA